MKPETTGKIIHFDKLFGGKSAAEVHREATCAGRFCPCGAPASHRAISFSPLGEVLSRQGLGYLKWLQKQNNGMLPLVDFRTGSTHHTEKFVRIGEAFSCDGCFSEMQKQMAKAPSWVLCEIDPGKPTADRSMVQVLAAEAATK